jgi:predicted nucleic acid-binding protein
MRITVDTNILVRAVVCDDMKHAETATRLLRDAEIIAVSLPLPL